MWTDVAGCRVGAASAPSWGLRRREGVGTAGREAVKSPRLRGEGRLLRLSRLVEEPMRLWRRRTSAGLPCRTLTPHTTASIYQANIPWKQCFIL